MVVGDLDIISVAIAPVEADPKLIVDPDAVLSGAIPGKLFQSKAGERKVPQRLGGVEKSELDPRRGLDAFEPPTEDAVALGISGECVNRDCWVSPWHHNRDMGSDEGERPSADVQRDCREGPNLARKARRSSLLSDSHKTSVLLTMGEYPEVCSSNHLSVATLSAGSGLTDLLKSVLSVPVSQPRGVRWYSVHSRLNDMILRAILSRGLQEFARAPDVVRDSGCHGERNAGRTVNAAQIVVVESGVQPRAEVPAMAWRAD